MKIYGKRAFAYILCLCLLVSFPFGARAKTATEIEAYLATAYEFTSYLDTIHILGHGAFYMGECSLLRDSSTIGNYYGYLENEVSLPQDAQLLTSANFCAYWDLCGEYYTYQCGKVYRMTNVFSITDDAECHICFSDTNEYIQFYYAPGSRVDAYYLMYENSLAPTWYGKHVYRNNFQMAESGSGV
ncbi:MAG: hypothetical protein IJQ53_08660 [Clostridia bacterium]|nr:hypothetical protein [Clostridia bacterium]